MIASERASQLWALAEGALVALDALADENERLDAEYKQRWPDAAFQRTANDLLAAVIRAEDEKQRADRAVAEATTLREALEEIFNAYDRGAISWAGCLSKARAALAAGRGLA